MISPTWGSPKRLAYAVHQHALADRERGLHGAAGDPVGLDDEGLDPEGEPEGHHDDDGQLDDRAPERFGGLGAGAHAGLIAGGLAVIGLTGIGGGLALALGVRPRSASCAACGSGAASSAGSPSTASCTPASTVGASATSASCVSVASGDLRLELGLVRMQQPGLDELLGAGVAALADAGALADAVTQVVELRAAHVASRASSIRSIFGECSGNMRSTPTPKDCLRTVNVSRDAVALALDDDTLEDLRRALRVPSTTWKWTFTRSPGEKPGTRRSCARSMVAMTLLIT